MTIKQNTLLLWALSVVPCLSQASSLYLSYNSEEQWAYVGENSYLLSPDGGSLLLNYDLSEDWSLSLDIGQLQDARQPDAPIRLSYKADAWGAGVSYYQEQWSAYYQYSVYNDKQSTLDNGPGPDSTLKIHSKTHSSGVSYHWVNNDNWQLTSSAGLHYSDWQQQQTDRPDDPDRAMTHTTTPGNATIGSIALNLTGFNRPNDVYELSYGSYVSWNQVFNSETQSQNTEQRAPNRRNRSEPNHNRNNLVASGSESYGLINVYVAVSVAENWILDVDASRDFGSDDNSHSWSMNLGYIF
ncbi:autotransporter outer membrane beta-barrel domain-containing protein [Planctobacterium marinum]|uniref:autotransporter outer membrane beta-barrel domain-containing protein n=1 Tax=Planctobacterium marinum TaxID=1631968 RepID=UPI001E30A782|nr:autotransporter outer membrane beta-barrel domain-containing protein [Planctobacterium marinum]MCC2605472.1 autotransporter outer membrane beta-barrel domain-containing protein [Planctobacterium marinum]